MEAYLPVDQSPPYAPCSTVPEISKNHTDTFRPIAAILDNNIQTIKLGYHHLQHFMYSSKTPFPAPKVWLFKETFLMRRLVLEPIKLNIGTVFLAIVH